MERLKTTKQKAKMKTIEQEEKVCGNCIHRKLGITEVYCHKKDMYVNEDRPACRAHILNPEAAEMKKKYIAPDLSLDNRKKAVRYNGRNPYIQPSNAAANYGTTLKVINQAVIELHLDTVRYRTGKSSRKHIKRSDLPKIKNYIIANGL